MCFLSAPCYTPGHLTKNTQYLIISSLLANSRLLEPFIHAYTIATFLQTASILPSATFIFSQEIYKNLRKDYYTSMDDTNRNKNVCREGEGTKGTGLVNTYLVPETKNQSIKQIMNFVVFIELDCIQKSWIIHPSFYCICDFLIYFMFLSL